MLRASLFALVFLVGTVTSTSAAKSHKVTICHIPPGNPANAHLITVDKSALPAHFGHGDPFASADPEDSMYDIDLEQVIAACTVE